MMESMETMESLLRDGRIKCEIFKGSKGMSTGEAQAYNKGLFDATWIAMLLHKMGDMCGYRYEITGEFREGKDGEEYLSNTDYGRIYPTPVPCTGASKHKGHIIREIEPTPSDMEAREANSRELIDLIVKEANEKIGD